MWSAVERDELYIRPVVVVFHFIALIINTQKFLFSNSLLGNEKDNSIISFTNKQQAIPDMQY